MGFTPQQVNAMSLWQWFAALNGYIEANTPKDSGSKLSESEADDIWNWIEQDGSGPRLVSTQTYWWDDDWPEAAGVVIFKA